MILGYLISTVTVHYSTMIFCVFTFVAKGPPLHYPPRSSSLFAFREVPNMVFGYVQMLHEAGAGSGCGNAEAKGRSGACSGQGPCAILEICIPGPPSGLDWWGWFEYNWICHNMSHSESFCELQYVSLKEASYPPKDTVNPWRSTSANKMHHAYSSYKTRFLAVLARRSFVFLAALRPLRPLRWSKTRHKRRFALKTYENLTKHETPPYLPYLLCTPRLQSENNVEIRWSCTCKYWRPHALFRCMLSVLMVTLWPYVWYIAALHSLKPCTHCGELWGLSGHRRRAKAVEHPGQFDRMKPWRFWGRD